MVKNNLINTFLFCILFTTMNYSCDDTISYDKKALTYKDKFVFDNQFRIDGIYLMRKNYADGYIIRYFFQDGFYYDEAISYEIEVECFQIKDKAREIPYAWGCFIVEGNILKIQTYDHFSVPRYCEFKVKEIWAEIVNDTTIHFFKEINPTGKEKERELDEIFHFKYCENKPDSTNILMGW